MHSLFFKKNQNNFEDQTDIEITEEAYISNDEFQAFVDCCQKKEFKITDSNVFSLHYLSIKYEVPGLTEYTQNYIETNHQKLVFPSLLFKQKIQTSDKYRFKNSQLLFNESKEEEIIAEHLDEYISDERLLSLEIPVIDRIMTIYFQKNQENKEKNYIVDFLIKYLKHNGKEASVIFTNIDLGNLDHEIIIRLHNECKNVFDFNMINSESLFKTTYELLSELKSIKFEMEKVTQACKEQLTAFNECKSEFISQMNQIREESKRMKDKLDAYESKQTKIEEKQTNMESKHKSIEEKQTNYEGMNQTHSQQYQQLLSKQNELSQQLSQQQQNLQSFQESLDQIDRKVSEITIPFTGDNEFNGIISHLRKNSNQNIEKIINVTSSSIYNNDQDFSPFKAVLFEETKKDFGSNGYQNNWICIDFKEHRIIPTHYTIRSGNNCSNRPRSWVIECSDDNNQWDILDEKINNQTFNNFKVSYTFKMNKQVTKEYRYIRMRNTGRDSNGTCYYLFINSIEFYGKLI